MYFNVVHYGFNDLYSCNSDAKITFFVMVKKFLPCCLTIIEKFQEHVEEKIQFKTIELYNFKKGEKSNTGVLILTSITAIFFLYVPVIDILCNYQYIKHSD